MTRKGFTLIELLVVVAVLALLASIVFSNLGGAREGARISNALSFESQTHSLLGSDLVGWWKFDGDLNDTSGYGNNGTWRNTGGPAPSEKFVDGVPGKSGKAIDFDGIGDYILSNSSLPSMFNFTISVWTKWDDFGTDKVQFIVAGANEQAEIHTGGASGTNGLRFILNTHTVSTLDVSNAIPDSSWHHYVAVYTNNDQVIVYRGGVEIGRKSHTITTETTANKFNIGRRNNNSLFFNGLIDDVRIYSRALTLGEVNKIYAQTKDRYLANE